MHNNRVQNTEFKIKTQWIMMTLNGLELCSEFQNDRTLGTGGSGPVLSRHHALQSPYTVCGVVGAANTSRRATAAPGPGNNTCKCFIESSFNACLKEMFRQDRRTPVT